MATSPATNSPRQIRSRSILTPQEREAARRERKVVTNRARRKRIRDAQRSPERREALALAGELQAALARYPSLALDINEFIYTLHQRGKQQCPDRVREDVERALRAGCATVEEISEDTLHPHPSIVAVLEGMRTLGTAEQVPRERPYAGRPAKELIWVLTGQRPRSDMVLP